MSWPTLQKMLNGSQQKGMSSSSMVPKIKKAYTHIMWMGLRIKMKNLR
jgi:hypothetical protein